MVDMPASGTPVHAPRQPTHLPTPRASLAVPHPSSSQNLEFPGATMCGTDIIRELKDAGYKNLICVRTVSVTDADVGLYFQSGAHCVLDKELSMADFTRQLVREYNQFAAARDCTASQPGLPVSVSGPGALQDSSGVPLSRLTFSDIP